MCAIEHFPDESSCIALAQGLSLVGSPTTEINHCMRDYCKVKHDKGRRLGFVYICNTKPVKKEMCFSKISPLHNTSFEGSHLAMFEIFSIIKFFVSKLLINWV